MTQTDPSRAAEAYVGFGAAEIAYLLSRFDEAQVATTLEVMGLNPQPGEEFLAAGASSLLARGMLTTVGDQLELAGFAAALAYALGDARHWTELGFMLDQDNAVDAALVVQAPELVMLLSPRALGTWFAMIKRPELSTAESVLLLADGFFGQQPGGAVFLSARTAASTATLFLRRQDADSWEIAKGAAPFWEESILAAADEGAVKVALTTLFSLDPSGS